MVTEVQHIGQQCAHSCRTLEGSHNIQTRLDTHQLKQTQPAEKVVESALQYQHDVDIAIEQIQKLSDKFDRRLQFRVNKDINRVIIKVIDVATDKVIREIPSEAVQKLHEEIESSSGLFFDKTV